MGENPASHVFKRDVEYPITDQEAFEKRLALQYAHVKSINSTKLVLEDPESVEKGVQMYRELYEQNKDFKPIEVILSKTPKQYAKEMMYMDYMGRCSEHIGFPVKAPPFVYESKVFFSVHHTLHAELGKLCRISISSCQPGTKRISMVVTETFFTTEKEAHIEIYVNNLVRECRMHGPSCLQLVIEGTYMETEDQCANGLGPGPFFTKRIEIWSKSASYNFSDKCTVECWPNKLSEMLSADVPTLFENLLNRPSKKQDIANSEKLLAIDVSVLLEDGTPANNVFDFNNNNTAIREIESNDTKNKKMAKEIDVQFKKRLIEMENVMKCITVTYEPACGFKRRVGIYCVVCKKSFRHIHELLFHMYTTYPNLTVSLQRIGGRKCKIILAVENLAITQLGRETMIFFDNEQQDTNYDFMGLMLTAQCGNVMFKKEEEWDMREAVNVTEIVENVLLCHVCKIRPGDYAKYIIDRRTLRKTITDNSSPMYVKMFWLLMKSFVSKTRCNGLCRLEPYVLMRMFLHCHALIIQEFGLRECFITFLKRDWEGFFGCEDLPLVLLSDLVCRLTNNKYEEIGPNAGWMYQYLWKQKDELQQKEGKEFKLLKEIVSEEFPISHEQQETVLNKICNDPFSGEFTKFTLIRNGMKDELGEPIFIPKCFYFGAAQEDDDVLSHNTYYEN